jgi:hypothetical protein
MEHCDAYIGVDYSKHSPVILRCKNLATRVVKTGKPGVFSELWLCDSHKDADYERAIGAASSPPEPKEEPRG